MLCISNVCGSIPSLELHLKLTSPASMDYMYQQNFSACGGLGEGHIEFLKFQNFKNSSVPPLFRRFFYLDRLFQVFLSFSISPHALPTCVRIRDKKTCALRVSIVNPYRIYYRNPYQNPKKPKKIRGWWKKMYPTYSPKMILMIYMIDLDNIFFNDFFSPTSNFFRLFWILVRVSIVNPYRIYYRNPYQNPKKLKKFRGWWKKIIEKNVV